MFLLQHPSSRDLEAFIECLPGLPLSYASVGMAEEAPAGFNLDRERIVLGRGEAVFARAKEALRKWKHFDLDWIEVHPQGALVQPGAVVAVLVRHLGFWSVNGCRVVSVTGESADARRSGFAYGTLTDHAESGEESFKVVFEEDSGDIVYQIRAVSRPRAPLARLGYPVARMLQARFRRDSMEAMRRIAG